MSLSWGALPQDLLNQVNEIMTKLKEHDVGVHDHCVRVSQLCRFLAEAADLSPYDQLVAQFAGLLHDAGKMTVDQDIINKPSRLDENEYMAMKDHAIASAELLEPLEDSSFFREVQVAVLHHHERMDGNGYPFGLEGEQIPYISRLILVVDTYDAMTETRAYRKGLPVEVAYAELEKCSGTQFDEELAQIFVAAHKELMASEDKGQLINLPRKIRAA